MCGRYTLRATPQELAEFFELTRAPELEDRPNICPTQSVLGITLADDSNKREARDFRWGLVPSWSRDPTGGAKMINARSETAAEKPAFRAAFKRRRCLIPADGFYEWRKVAGQKKKQPCYVSVHDQPLIAFAGLWERWEKENQDPLITCTILTTSANSKISAIHDRMPVILHPETYDLWLAAGSDTEELKALMQPYPSEEIDMSEDMADRLLSSGERGHQGSLF